MQDLGRQPLWASAPCHAGLTPVASAPLEDGTDPTKLQGNEPSVTSSKMRLYPDDDSGTERVDFTTHHKIHRVFPKPGT